MRSAAREVLSFLIWVPIALPVGVGYGAFLVHGLGRHMGLEGPAIVFVFPIAMLAFAVVLWLPAWRALRQKRRRRLGKLAPLVAIGLLAMALLVVCQLDCFRFSGPEPLLAYFMAVPVAFAAWLHDSMSRIWLTSDAGGVS